jgi:tetratricopeptide (TPR) repeat protein
MSKQVIDSIYRLLRSASLSLEKQKYDKVLEILEKAEKQLKGKDEPQLVHMTLLLKGRVYEDTERLNEALDIYENAFELSSDLFFKDCTDHPSQEALADSILSVARILGKIDENTLAEGICKKENEIFGKICEEYAELFSYNSDDVEYLANYLRVGSGIVFCYMVAQQAESQLPLVLDIMDTYGKIMELDPDDPNTSDSLYEMAEQFADYCMDNGHMEEAKQVYEKLQDISENILKGRPDDEKLVGLMVKTYNLVASFCIMISETEKAYQYYLKLLAVVENQLIGEPDNLFYLLYRSKVFEKIGLLFSGSEDYDKARPYYEKALEAFEELFELPQKYGFLFENYIELLEDIVVFFEGNGPFNETLRCYLNEVRVFNSMIEADIDVTDNKLCIAETFDQIAKLYGFEEDTEKAKEYFEKELAVYEELCLENPGEVDYEVYIARTFDLMGLLYSDNDEELAEEYYKKAMGIYKRVGVEVPEHVGMLLGNIRTLKNLGNFYNDRGQYDTAISFLHQSIDILEEMVKGLPDKGVLFMELGNLYSALAGIYDSTEDAAMSGQFHTKALDTYSYLLFDEKCILYTRDQLAREILLTGSFYMRNENYEVSMSYLELCNRYYENICKRDMSNIEIVECFARTLRQIGFIKFSTGYSEEGISKYESSLVLLEIASRDNADDLVLLSNTATVYVWLAEAYFAVDKLELSKQAFEKSIDTLEDILAKYPEQRYLFLDLQIKAFSGYADVLSVMGDAEEAVLYDSKAQELRSEFEKLFQDDEFVID